MSELPSYEQAVRTATKDNRHYLTPEKRTKLGHRYCTCVDCGRAVVEVLGGAAGSALDKGCN